MKTNTLPLLTALLLAPLAALHLSMNIRRRFVTMKQAVGLCLALLMAVPLLAQTTNPNKPPETAAVSGSVGNQADAKLDYPTDAVRKGMRGGHIFSALTWQQARQGVPAIKIVNKKEEEIEYIGDKKNLIDLRYWQESPSRIIYHEGKYHTWIMHIEWYDDLRAAAEAAGKSNDSSVFKNYYLTSIDGYRWNVEGEFPVGEPGSFDDKRREGIQVVKWEGKFWMFYQGTSKKGAWTTQGIGLLVADRPSGPWSRAADGPVLKATDDQTSWDLSIPNNPYPVYYKGKWFIYYKSNNPKLPEGRSTLQGVAVSDSITGPYVRYENNPVVDGHGSFVWAYRGGITMLPFVTAGPIHWSPDGLHWHNVDDPASRGIKTPIYSAFYLPHDPLSGDPQASREPDEFWGLETRQTSNKNPRDWKIFRGTITFNPAKNK